VLVVEMEEVAEAAAGIEAGMEMVEAMGRVGTGTGIITTTTVGMGVVAGVEAGMSISGTNPRGEITRDGAYLAGVG